MANPNAPFGGRVINTLIASDFNSKLHTYTTSATDAVPLFVGDFVRMTNVTDVYGTPYITQVKSTDLDIVGIVISMKNAITQENRIYRAANEVLEVQVLDDPLVEFEIQVNGPVTINSIGQFANLIVGAGSTLTGMSGMQIDIVSTPQNPQLLIIGMLARSDNTLGSYAKVRAIIWNHKFLNRTLDNFNLSTTDIYVDGNKAAGYTETGSMFFPFRTIQAAINYIGLAVITNMITVHIVSAIYVENVIFENVNLRKIQLKGDSSQGVIISPTTGDSIRSITNNSNFTDLVITDLQTTMPIEMTGTSNFMLHGFTIQNCDINNNLSCDHANLVLGNGINFNGNITLTNDTTAQFFDIFSEKQLTVSGNSTCYLYSSEFSVGPITVSDTASFVLFRSNVITGVVTINGSIDSFHNKYMNLVTIGTTGSGYSVCDVYNQGYTVTSGGNLTINDIASSLSHNITAHAGGGQANATPAYGKIVDISSSASTGDSIMLDHAYNGAWVLIKNRSTEANAVNVYPQVGDYMDTIINNPKSLASAGVIICYCYANGYWQSLEIK
jgi:hypothetical protein